MEFALAIESASAYGQDRVAVLPFRQGHLIVLADGAGGSAGGTEAADAVVALAGRLDPTTEPDWKQVLSGFDGLLGSERLLGETTAVLALVNQGHITGASTGDSEAWSFLGGASLELTCRQRRKPLLGSGRAAPVGFGPVPVGERLLVASDGLFKYVARDLVPRLAMLSPREAVAALINAARLPNGSLQDDIAIIVAG